MTPHYKAVATRICKLLNAGVIKKKSEAVGGGLTIWDYDVKQ